MERILAIDRADIPAVTQRQRLAQQDNRVTGQSKSSPRPRLGRCEIPDWFDQLRNHAQAELADLEQRAADNAATRERLQADLTAAQRDVNRLDEPTRRQRDQLAAAHHDLDDAKVEHRRTIYRLETSGLRGRRQARRDLAAAQNRLTWANHTLDQLQQQASPDLDRYHEATRQVRELSDELRHRATRELLDRYTTTDRFPELQQRLDALDAWWRFANGDSINLSRLGQLVDVLGTADGDHGSHCRWLADAVEQHCHDAHIHIRDRQLEAPGIEAPCLDIGL